MIKQTEGKFEATTLNQRTRKNRINTGGKGCDSMIFNQNHLKICDKLCSLSENSKKIDAQQGIC